MATRISGLEKATIANLEIKLCAVIISRGYISSTYVSNTYIAWLKILAWGLMLYYRDTSRPYNSGILFEWKQI